MPKPRRESQGSLRKRAPRAVGTLPFTLLSDPTPLIDRDQELEDLRQHLLGDSVRLLTVMGPGGVGKTRLALAAARSVEGAFPDGVWFIDLVPLQDPTHIDATIAQALHLKDLAADSPRERVTAFLRPRRGLLVLDNFEHVLSAATRIAELLTTCPHLRVLVTSREPLNLRLEHRMLLQGLAVPTLDRPTPETVTRAASGALFLERAKLVQPDFTPSPEDARALAELLHRLDGMPLAIQITAARSNVLSPGAMLARLQGPALLSTEEARDVPLRHHTLRDAIEWSHALLESGEQRLFRQLGVFAGGWTLEAAEDIVERRDPGAPLWQTLRSLVEKSLVQTEIVGGADRRYRMLETIREFALERLAASGDLDTARQRHAAYYLALAEQAELEWWGSEEQTWVRRMAQEHENFKAVLRWAGERGDDLSVRLAGALGDFWLIRGYLREGRRWLEQALSLSPDGPPRSRAKALVAAGTLAGTMGDYPAARGFLQDALEISVGDPAATARALTRFGAVAMFEGDIPEAQALQERSLALCRGLQDLRWQAHTLVLLGVARMLHGDLDRAEATLTESLDLCRTVGNRRLAVHVMSHLARVKLQRRDDAGATGLAAAALTAAREVAQTNALWAAVATAAFVSAHHDDLDRAVRLLAAVDAWSEWTGHFFVVAPAAREARKEITARARHQMGDSAYETAVAEGHALSADDAVDLARAALEPRTRARPEQATSTGEARPRELLSDRERAVLGLVGEGLPNKQIATALAIAESTVKSYVTSAMNKLGADNRAQAVVAAIQRGLL